MDEIDSTARPPSATRLSRTPSWVMLGFLLGGLFVWFLPHPEAPPAAAPAAVTKSEPPPPLAPPRLTTVEAIFAEWGSYAIWENDVTEVVLWNPEANAFTDGFEVLREGEHYYFRSISRLTRPILTRGVKENSPLQFTETVAHRDEWLRQVREENARAFRDAARETFGPQQSPSPPNPASVPPPTGPGDGR